MRRVKFVAGDMKRCAAEQQQQQQAGSIFTNSTKNKDRVPDSVASQQQHSLNNGSSLGLLLTARIDVKSPTTAEPLDLSIRRREALSRYHQHQATSQHLLREHSSPYHGLMSPAQVMMNQKTAQTRAMITQIQSLDPRYLLALLHQQSQQSPQLQIGNVLSPPYLHTPSSSHDTRARILKQLWNNQQQHQDHTTSTSKSILLASLDDIVDIPALGFPQPGLLTALSSFEIFAQLSNASIVQRGSFTTMPCNTGLTNGPLLSDSSSRYPPPPVGTVPSQNMYYHSTVPQIVHGGVGATVFPVVLHQLLLELERSAGAGPDIAGFLPDGKSFQIWRVNVFEKDILPHYFPKMKGYASFQRQLNLYDFQRMGSSRYRGKRGSYRHDLFLRDFPVLVGQMKRFKIKGGNTQVGRSKSCVTHAK